MEIKTERLLNFTLIANSLLFVILFCTLSFNARLVSDDFYYLYLKNHYGAWDGMLFQYKNWSGRWAAHWIACGLLRFWKNSFFLPLINLTTLACLFLVIRSFLKKLFIDLNITRDNIILPGFSLLLITSFFFSTFNIGESWFWHIIIITYLWSLIAFLFILNFIFSSEKNYRWLLAIPAALFIGGASESFALIFILALVIILFEKRKLETPSVKNVFLKAVILLIVLAGSFLVSWLAPGTEIRRSLLPQTTLIFKLTSYVKSLAKYFIIYLPKHAGYIFIFSFPWLFLGGYMQSRFTIAALNRSLKRVSAIFVPSLAILYIPTTYIMSDAGPDRAMLLIFLVTVVYSAFLALVAGYFLVGMRYFRVMATFVTTGSVLILMTIVFFQSEITSIFSSVYDLNMSQIMLEKEKNTTGTVILSRLPDNGMLYWEEFSSDTGYFVNQHIRKGLDLPFAVAVRK